MRRHWKTILGISLVAVLICGTCLVAKTNGLDTPYYSAAQDVFLPDILPPPPVPGSSADKDDLAAVLKAQDERSKAQVQEARQDVVLSIFRFQSVMGTAFKTESLPFTTLFFDRVEKDEDRIVHQAKRYYNRSRPFSASKLVQPVVPKLISAAYPSGHTTFAYVSAILLSQMVPENRDRIFERAKSFAQNRLIAGVHYPSDILAGKISAAVIVSRLMQDKEFMADFEKARKELRGQLGLK